MGSNPTPSAIKNNDLQHILQPSLPGFVRDGGSFSSGVNVSDALEGEGSPGTRRCGRKSRPTYASSTNSSDIKPQSRASSAGTVEPLNCFHERRDQGAAERAGTALERRDDARDRPHLCHRHRAEVGHDEIDAAGGYTLQDDERLRDFEPSARSCWEEAIAAALMPQERCWRNRLMMKELRTECAISRMSKSARC